MALLCVVAGGLWAASQTRSNSARRFKPLKEHMVTRVVFYEPRQPLGSDSVVTGRCTNSGLSERRSAGRCYTDTEQAGDPCFVVSAGSRLYYCPKSPWEESGLYVEDQS